MILCTAHSPASPLFGSLLCFRAFAFAPQRLFAFQSAIQGWDHTGADQRLDPGFGNAVSEEINENMPVYTETNVEHRMRGR